MIAEPTGCKIGGGLQSPRLFEEVGCARDDLHSFLALEPVEGRAVHFDDGMVEAADNEEGGGGDIWKNPVREVGPAAARDDGVNDRSELRGGDEGGGGTCAGAEIAGGDCASAGTHPVSHFDETLREEGNIETEMRSAGFGDFLLFGEQIEEECSDAVFLQDGSDEAVAGTFAATTAAMREQDQAAGVFGDN